MCSILKEIRSTDYPEEGGERPRNLEVYVVFTDVPATLSALRTAAQLAQGLTSRIRLLLVETVPFLRELDSPQRDIRFLGRQFRTLIDISSAETASRSVETVAEILLCRDAFVALHGKLPANSVVVIGKRNRWWPSREDRLAKRLRADGHHVVRTATASAPRLPQFGWRVWANA
jgi:hypothetical protein